MCYVLGLRVGKKFRKDRVMCMADDLIKMTETYKYGMRRTGNEDWEPVMTSEYE